MRSAMIQIHINCAINVEYQIVGDGSKPFRNGKIN